MLSAPTGSVLALTTTYGCPTPRFDMAPAHAVWARVSGGVERDYFGSYAELGALREPTATVTRAGTFLGVIASDAGWTSILGDGLEAHAAGRTWTVPTRGDVLGPAMIGTHLAFASADAAGVVVLYAADDAGTTTELYRPAAGSAIVSFVTDGVDLAWTESEARGEVLHTSPYGESPGALAPREVATLGPRRVSTARIVVGAGWFAYSTNERPRAIELVRLSDGATLHHSLVGSGNYPSEALWVGPTELGYVEMGLDTSWGATVPLSMLSP